MQITRKFRLIFIGFMLVFLPLQLPVVFSAENADEQTADCAQSVVKEQSIKVGLVVGHKSVTVSAGGEFDIINTDTKTVLDRFAANSSVVVTISKKQELLVNNKPFYGSSLIVKPVCNSEDSSVILNNHKYRGTLEIFRTNSRAGLTAVNIVLLEHYLYGVLPREIITNWPMEAIKAQAVAARSYAMYSLNKHEAEGYDVCDTTDCQVYGGKDSENLRTTKAVNDTRGLVLTYNNQIIQAFFHSSGGRHTEDAEKVWGTNTPYLRGVADFEHNSPYDSWNKKIPIKDFSYIIKRAGYDIGIFKNVLLSPFVRNSVQIAPDRSRSGRVQFLKLCGSKGQVKITGIKLRSMLGLPSTLFDIKISGQYIIINGSGSGHGIGMSQWGAKAMADNAPEGDNSFYQTILKHYYQGVEIQKDY